MNSFVLKGNIAYSENKDKLVTCARGYVVCVDGVCRGTFQKLPAAFSTLPLYDCGNHLIIPGMTDLHVHAPQYSFRGIGMELELLDWLNTYTFPEESRYADIDYAREAYQYFAYDLKRSFTTRACIFATLHTPATIALMDMLEETGLITYVGKVNMDRNSEEGLEEASAAESICETLRWIAETDRKYTNTFPILTPRFIPVCSDELMGELGELAKEKGLRIQSHLSENPSEIAWVKELVPQSTCYANAYELFGNMGCEERPTIMAHCVYSDDCEQEILKKHGVYVAHCADSNMNLSSGIAPIRRFLSKGIKVGLGTDVAAGSSMNMLATMLATIQASKMYWRLVDSNMEPLSFSEVFYLATAGGGSYFGKVGAFQDGYEFDALVIDDNMMVTTRELSVKDRVERLCYNDSDCIILQKFVRGNKVFER